MLGADRSSGFDPVSGVAYVNFTSSLVRADGQGNALWQNDLLIGESDVNLNSFVLTVAGIVLAGECFNGTCLVSVDSGGNVQWVQTLNGTYGSYVRSFIQTTDGGFAAVGTYFPSSASGNGLTWLVKTDGFGDVLWNETVTSFTGSAASIVESSDGGYAVVGTQTTPGSSQPALEIVKVDSTGIVEWTKTYVAPVQDGVYWAASANDAIATSDGGYLIAGTLSRVNSQNAPTHGWMVKTDSLGNLEWNKTVGGDGSYVSSVVQTVDGGYAYAGALGQDALAGKTDALGNMGWNLTFPGVSIFTPGKSIIQTNDTGYALVGASNGSIVLEKTAPEPAIATSPETTIVIAATAGGTTDPVPGTYTCNASTQVSLLAKPNPGYYFEGWVSGNQELKFNPLVFTTANGTYNIEALFKESSRSNLSDVASFLSSTQGVAVVSTATLSVVVASAVIFRKRRTETQKKFQH
jgi:hypothetical protein